MADERLQRLERQLAAGDPGVEPQVLLERVRAGRLERSMLELAAYLGYQAALAATGGTACAGQVEDWVRGLNPWTPAATLRAAAAATWPALYQAERLGPHPALRSVLEASEDYVRCPCEDHAEAMVVATRERAPGAWPPAATLVTGLSALIRSWERKEAAALLNFPSIEAMNASHIETALRLNPELRPVVRDAVRNELLAWALGIWDPVAARSETRSA